MLAEKRFRGRTDAKTLGKLLASAVRYPCDFGSKALNVLLFLVEQRFGDKHGHEHILVTELLEAAVEDRLNVFPYCVSVRAYYHAALYARISDEIRFQTDIRVPFGKVFVH